MPVDGEYYCVVCGEKITGTTHRCISDPIERQLIKINTQLVKISEQIEFATKSLCELVEHVKIDEASR